MSDELLTAALGVFDAMSPKVLRQVREQRTQGARVTISPRALLRLLWAIEAERPGIVEKYVDVHREGFRRG